VARLPAAYSLHTVQALARQPPPTAPLFNAAKSTEVVSDRLDVSFTEAKRFICDTICDLTEGNFSSTVPAPPPPADVYGVERQGTGWYIKVKIESPRLRIVSFHPPEHPFRIANGETIRCR